MDSTNQNRKSTFLYLFSLTLSVIGFVNCNQLSGLIGNSALEKELQDTRTLALLGLVKPGETSNTCNGNNGNGNGSGNCTGNGNPIDNPNNNAGGIPSEPLIPPPEPLKNIWASLSNLPRFFSSSTSQTIGDKIYIFGNQDVGRTGSAAYSYDTVTSRWNKLKDMPESRFGSSSATIGNKIYILGGLGYYYGVSYDPPPYCAQQIFSICLQYIDPPPQYGYLTRNVNSVYIYDTSTDTWTKGAEMLMSSSFHSSIAFNGKIYLFSQGIVDVYDSVTNQWSRLLTNSPILSYYSIQVYQDKFYFFAGYSNLNSNFNNVFEFNPATLTFSQKTNMPTTRIYAVTAVVGDKIYVLGGNYYYNSRAIEEYTPSTNSWTVKPSLPEGANLSYAMGGYANGRIYGIGGWYSVVAYYDPVAETSTHLKVRMGQARNSFASAIYNDKYFVFGGYGGGTSSSWIETYDMNTNSWSKIGDLANAKHGFKAAVIGNKIYLVGGIRGTTSLSEVEIYDPATGTFTAGTPLDTPRAYLSLCVNNDKLYAIGGNNGNTLLNTIEEFDPKTNQWSYKRTMTSARTETACTFHENNLYVFGGRTGDSSYTTTVESYNPQSDSWSLHSPMNTARALFDVVKLRGRIYAIGGWSGGSLAQVEKYDPNLEQWIPEYPMNSARHGTSAIAPDTNRIIVVGGQNGNIQLDTAEVFY
ncbi:Kelch repeat-containing protein [Leptospira limi]|uniref:Attractin/MKLN-like beta-propeller domain-containing protein n=1 Tax=Leptospira limi TaxID=2950023 RepID=A0ABT3LUM8_9LEPT|nr:kelch repeat-containing protein [Leptospira limi]MCW7461441.1 hypothetical protein [Leptospira limi]